MSDEQIPNGGTSMTDQEALNKVNAEAEKEIATLGNGGAAIIPFLFAIGIILNRIPWFPSYIIPLALIVLGGVIACLVKGWTGENFFRGAIIGSSTVGVHQLLYQPGIIPSGF